MVPPPEAPVALGTEVGVDLGPRHGPIVLHLDAPLVKPRDWPHGPLQWWAWCDAFHSAAWESRAGTFQPGLEAALLFWRRSPGILRYYGAAATACDLLVHFKAVQAQSDGLSPFVGAVAWPRGAWRGAYMQRTADEQKWLERALLRASRLGRVPRDWVFSLGAVA